MRFALPFARRSNQLDPNNPRLWRDPLTGFAYDVGSITPLSAMRESTVFSCVRVISDTVAQLPLNLMRRLADSDTELAEDDRLFRILRYSPNTWQTPYDYWKFNINSLMLSGFMLSKKLRNGKGEIIGLVPCHPNFTEISQAADGTLIFKTATTIQVKQGDYVTREVLTQADVLYAPYATIDGVTPISPISQNAEVIGLSKEMRKHGRLLFENEAAPPGVLYTDKVLSDTAYKRLAESWKANQGGDKRGNPAILEEGLRWEKVSISNQDAQYLESRQYTKEEICGVFGVPTHMVSDAKAAKGWSTLESQLQEFHAMTINPVLTRFEEAIRLHLIPRGQWGTLYANFNEASLLRTDTKTKVERDVKYLQNGVLSPNEVRKSNGWNNRDEGDEYMTPVNMQLTGDTNDEVMTDANQA